MTFTYTADKTMERDGFIVDEGIFVMLSVLKSRNYLLATWLLALLHTWEVYIALVNTQNTVRSHK